MANKEQVARLHDEHPDWSVREVADALNCHPSYVRATAARGGYRFPGTLEKRELGLRTAARALLDVIADTYFDGDQLAAIDGPSEALRKALGEYSGNIDAEEDAEIRSYERLQHKINAKEGNI